MKNTAMKPRFGAPGQSKGSAVREKPAKAAAAGIPAGKVTRKPRLGASGQEGAR